MTGEAFITMKAFFVSGGSNAAILSVLKNKSIELPCRGVISIRNKVLF